MDQPSEARLAAGAPAPVRGRFISLEGGEGAGKSTQQGLLTKRLEALGHAVTSTREPGGTPFADVARGLLLGADAPERVALADALVFSAARADHVARVIEPALAAGRWVICDRFIDSTRAYQGAAGGLAPGVIADLERISTGGLLPDLTIILDLAPEVGLGRARRRGEGEHPDRYEARDLAYHARLREAFRTIAANEPERCVVVAAEGEVADVAAAVWAVVEARLAP
ncbi:MAG: dTMP kinase [Rhizobiales bacterium]|nr:dTMP kinase [Hyphomicrobiales bacterium]